MFTRENFEENVIDYLEGNMSSEQEALFLKFLKANPDLEEELSAVRDMKLNAEPVGFPGKNELYKLMPSDREKILEDAFEEAAVAYHEGDLSPDKKLDMEILVQNNKDFKDSFELYSNTFLEPDLSVEFPGKSSLKKLTIAQKRTRLVTIISSAAAVIILLILFLNPEKENIQTNLVQEQNTPGEIIHIPVIEPVPAQVIPTKIPVSPGIALTLEHKERPTADKHLDLSLPQLASVSEIIPNDRKPEGTIISPENTGEAVAANEYLSIGEFARERFITRVFNRDGSGEQGNSTFWNLALNGIEGFSRLTDGDIYVNREKNQEGEVERITFETAVFGFSAPTRNDDLLQ